MTIVDRLVGHDCWTTRQLLLRCRELSDDALSRQFDIGDRSLMGTFEHLISCMESHVDLLLGRRTHENYLETKELRDDESIDGMLVRLVVVSKDFAELTAKVELEGRADDMCSQPDSTKKWPLGSVIAHILTHSMHHRAQIMYMLEQLGIEDVIEGDALGWEGEARGWGYGWCNSYGKVVRD